MPRRRLALVALLLQTAAAFRPPPTRLNQYRRGHATAIAPPSDADKLARDRLIKTSVVLLVPSLAVGAISLVAFPALCRGMRSAFGVATLAVLSGDQGQFIQNFLSVIGILFSLLIGNTYAFCYNQQVMVYMALFEEVSVAKALLEQATLVCQGRPSYAGVLDDVQRYVDRDLKRAIVARRFIIDAPRDDPLEAIMWQTSVGTPGAIYDTVRWLRRARGERLGAMQRKLPPLHFALLFLLGILEVCAFPLLSAGAATTVGAGALRVEAAMFALMTAALTLTLGVGAIVETAARPVRWTLALAVMVEGLEDELNASGRRTGRAPRTCRRRQSLVFFCHGVLVGNDQHTPSPSPESESRKGSSATRVSSTMRVETRKKRPLGTRSRASAPGARRRPRRGRLHHRDVRHLFSANSARRRLRRRSPHVPDAEPAVVARRDEPRVGEPRHADALRPWPRSPLRRAAARVPH